MKLRVFSNLTHEGYWSFAPIVVYGSKGMFGVGFFTLVFELSADGFWEKL